MECKHIINHRRLDGDADAFLNSAPCPRLPPQKAVDLMSQVPKLCNDMMNLGRLQGYEVLRPSCDLPATFSCCPAQEEADLLFVAG